MFVCYRKRDLSRAKYEFPIMKGPAQDCGCCSRQCDPSIFNYMYYQMCNGCTSSYITEAKEELRTLREFDKELSELFN